LTLLLCYIYFVVANCNVDIRKSKLCGISISDWGTKTCLLCPLGQLQSLNCDKIPQLHSMDKKANIETPSCQTIPNYIPN